ncbi:protein-L-isoaspartate(D-aspartate) O-methyltransferase [Rhodohalobacter sp. 8-1]|uniref:protein-L-isoaspartate(D-aspartate) O-methyltransferase n=1 Tax=Rhodohalobacter sp. 8-1 TaxID=3131972 RepID=UPI0030EEE53E
MDSLLQQKEEMIERQLRSRGIDDERVLSAMEEVPREKFIKKDLVEFAYRDAPLPIEEEQTISQPYIVALMAQILELEPSDKVLDVGTGSGYAAAVMSRIADEVYTVERHKVLAETASKRFQDLGYDNIFVLHGDGTQGWEEHAPYDAINVAAGGPDVPEPLKEQLAEDGRLIIPVGKEPRQQRLVKLNKADGEIQRKNLGRVQFVPLIGLSGWENEDRESDVKSKKPAPSKQSLPDMIAGEAEPFSDIDSAELAPLLERIGDSRVVLLGEATHGTSEFYRMRSRITRALVEEKGFNIVAVEADWPDAAHIDRFVRDTNVELPTQKPFTKFPSWMWRNEETKDLISKLRLYNDTVETHDDKVGFFGLDLYSLYSSIDAVINYLSDVDPDLSELAKRRYSCLTPYENNPARYGAAASSGRFRNCEKGVVNMLEEMLENRVELTTHDGDKYLDAVQNARLVANAERYYRSMYVSSNQSWNQRDSHMFETLQALLDYENSDSKAVVWAHNSHVGNAMATEMSGRGEHNIGQLAKEEYGDDTYNVGFGTDHGTVAAASMWGGQMNFKDIRPSLDDSYERVMHQSDVEKFMLPLRDKSKTVIKKLEKSHLERAIGVIYRPETELQSHYFQASLPNQFDEYIWFDETKAITPVETSTAEGEDKMPETYPFGV